MVTLAFSNSAQLSVSKAVLSHFSPVFSEPKKDIADDAESAIHLANVDCLAFASAVEFLLWGQLPGGEKNVALLHVAESYDFSILKQAIESDLCQSLDALRQDNDIEFLLELSQSYRMLKFAKVLDMQFAAQLHSIEAISMETLSKAFSIDT